MVNLVTPAGTLVLPVDYAYIEALMLSFLRHVFSVQFTEEEFTMRSREMYDRHAALVSTDPESVSVYGVKAQSELNNSKYFHVVDGLPSDIMHDILEGVLPLQFKVMLRKFVVEERRFTIEELNRRIQGFAFGTNDFRNKPSLLKKITASDCPIRQSGIVPDKFLVMFNKSNFNFENNGAFVL